MKADTGKQRRLKIKFRPEYPYVIICEGKDEYAFLISYLNYLEKNEEAFVDCHNVIDFGGITDVNQGLKNLKMYPGYEDMKGFLIVRDAERDARGAVRSVKHHVKQVWGLDLDDDGEIRISDEGVKIGYYLLPGLDEGGSFVNGTLEDLCVDIIAGSSDSTYAEDLMLITDNYMLNLIENRGKNFICPHKNRLHLFLSATDKYVGAKVGEAASWGAFDLASPKLAQLKKLILQMQG